MNENILKEVLAEISDEEISEFEQMPPFKPSLRHKIAMKRIFAEFEKNARKAPVAPAPDLTAPGSRMRLSKRLIILIIVIACAALLTGAVIVYVSKNFTGNVYSDNTHLFAVNTEGSPTAIEQEYYLSELPEGFEMKKHDLAQFDAYTLYKNSLSDQSIAFYQYTKEAFQVHYNTEHQSFVEIEIDGSAGLCLDFGNNEHPHSLVVWDNGDYILEIIGDLSKSDNIKLAKSAKILEN